MEKNDILKKLSCEESQEYKEIVSMPSLIIENGQPDPTILQLKEGQTIEDFMRENGFTYGDDIIGQIRNICNS